MTITKRTSIALEIVSAIAVVLSLIFVAFEIRNSSEQVEQNTQALQVQAYQDLISRIVELNAIGIEEGLTIENLLHLENPTKAQIAKLRSFLWILFRHGDMAYFQYEQQAISEERLYSALAPLLGRLSYPAVVSRWEEIEWSFVPSYREFVWEEIEKLHAEDDGK